MAAAPDDLAEILRQATGSPDPGQEPRGNTTFGTFDSNQFARLVRSGPGLEQFMALRYARIGGAQDRSQRYRVAEYLRRQRAGSTSELGATLAAHNVSSLPPHLLRKKLGKQGKLYTLADIQRNVIANNQAVQRAKEKAEIADNQRRRSADAFSRRLATNVATGSVTADLLGVIGTELNAELLERKQRAFRERGFGATNRTGAAATRPVSGAGLTNRTGAGATAKPATGRGTVAGDAKLLVPGVTAASAKGLRTGGVSVKGQTTEGAASRAARAFMAQSRSLPSLKQGVRNAMSSASRLANQFRLSLPNFPTLRMAPRLSTRTAPTTRTPARVGVALPLTSLNPTLLGSQVQQAKCDCPKPPAKRKKDGDERCTNPIISRTEQDGIITTKRKLKCQPSKPK